MCESIEAPVSGIEHRTVALIGNPNVGKSSLFNALTGLHQHTGNWPGKTVSVAQGTCSIHGKDCTLIDLPGAYSLQACSEEEEISRTYILSGQADCTIVVGDATCLERNLLLLFQVLAVSHSVIFCVNLIDEAERANIRVDLNRLQAELGIPVVGTSATEGRGLAHLKLEIECALQEPRHSETLALPDREALFSEDGVQSEKVCQELSLLAHTICSHSISMPSARKLALFDRIALAPWGGWLLLLSLLLGIFWLTIKGANYPSSMLQAMFAAIKSTILPWTAAWPRWLSGMLLDGVYETVAKVVAVMLPPMAIFFPLFTLLEDIGYLPRVSFLTDHAFERCGSCGKQCLTMAMGFGCNAAGVVGCRIISSRREQLIAILTNALVPCNGRFPALIVLITIFFSDRSLIGALIVTGFVLLSVFVTFAASGFLSHTVLKGAQSHFILEIPPYRKPKVLQILVRSLIDRTIRILWRAVVVAAPVGVIIWLLQNIQLDGVSLLVRFADALDPVGLFFGLNGIILAAFILSFPANELLLPLLVMITQGAPGAFEVSATTVGSVLTAGGWNRSLALATILFLLFHWPCSTTCLTIYHETRSWKWTLLAFLLPTVIGLGLCFLLARI